MHSLGNQKAFVYFNWLITQRDYSGLLWMLTAFFSFYYFSLAVLTVYIVLKRNL